MDTPVLNRRYDRTYVDATAVSIFGRRRPAPVFEGVNVGHFTSFTTDMHMSYKFFSIESGVLLLIWLCKN